MIPLPNPALQDNAGPAYWLDPSGIAAVCLSVDKAPETL